MILSASLQTCAPQRPCVDLRAHLRAATRPLHDEVDALYAAFDRRTASGHACFLRAQLAAWTALAAPWRGFVSSTLDCSAPDYPGMLRDDLAEIDQPCPADPFAVTAPAVIEPAGVIYVLAGSRLGIAAMRKEPGWNDLYGRAGRFMNDQQGGKVFKALLRHFDADAGAQLDPGRLCEAAEMAFGLFIATARLQQEAAR